MDTATEQSLALYHFDGCPYCARVRDTLDELGVRVELRDIREESRFRRELDTARGSSTVPVLRINEPGGEEQWLPESSDIVEYLRARYG